MSITHWGGYPFTSHDPVMATWHDVAGIYIFARSNPLTRQWQALYIGQASSFRNRLANHERWDEARRLGATHVHLMPLLAGRDGVERLLIQTFQPILNQQLK